MEEEEAEILGNISAEIVYFHHLHLFHLKISTDDSIPETHILTENVLLPNKQLIEKILKLEAELKVAKDFAKQNQQLIENNLQLQTELIVAKEKELLLEEVILNMESLQVENRKLKAELGEKSKDLYSQCSDNVELMEYYTRFTPAAFEAIFSSLLPIKEHDRCALDLRRKSFS